MRDNEPAGTEPEPRPFQVFLCHCSEDKPLVREVHACLLKEGLRPWLDEVDLKPGDKWKPAIHRAVWASDIVLVLLSSQSLDKEGFVQKEIGFALDRAEEKPEAKRYIIPVKLEPCELPERLSEWHSVAWYDDAGRDRLLETLVEEAGTRCGRRTDTPGVAAATPWPSTVVNEKDGSELVLVPAGEFEMGDGLDADCPKHRVYLDAYYIGRYCVTNAQYARFVSETGHRAPDRADFGDPVWQNGRYPEEQADHPVVCVSWDDAQAYAAWAGLALPTEAQWEKAARGPANTSYPWGDDWDASKCRNATNIGSGTTAAVDEYPSGVSGYGTYQQSGNVWEWCADWYAADYYQKSPRANPTGPTAGSYRVYRGGGWGGGRAAYFRGAGRDQVGPARRYDYLGFRLVRAAVLVPPGGSAARSEPPAPEPREGAESREGAAGTWPGEVPFGRGRV